MIRLLLLLALASVASADPIPAGTRAHATRRSGDIKVDGHLDEAAWRSVPRQGNFVQRFPKDGAKATEDTECAFLYDDDAIYVGVWAHDKEPDKIRALLTRRDVDALSHAILIRIDSYHHSR